MMDGCHGVLDMILCQDWSETNQEQGVGIQRQASGVEAQPVQPTLRILQSCEHVPPSEAFVMRGVAIGREAGQDELPFNGRDEGGRVRVVLDEVIARSSHNDGGKALLRVWLAVGLSKRLEILTDQDEDPVPTVWPNDTPHETDSLEGR
jgi:hypothetical protein